MEAHYQVIETAITKMGIDPIACRGKNPGQWSLIKGSIRVWLDLWFIEREKRAYFQAISRVVPLPDSDKVNFFQELLEINDKIFGCAFTIYKDFAWVKTIREVDGLDANEAYAMITRISNYADNYDNYLTEKYDVQTLPKNPPVGPGPSSDM